MTKRVAIIASGETERRALPYLLANLSEMDILISEVRIPPSNGALNPDIATKLIEAIWWSSNPDERPYKIVVLLDIDGKTPTGVLEQFSDRFPQRLNDKIKASVLFTYAQWHLEAWYFGDAKNLQIHLKENFNRDDLGNVNLSNPDEIQNPKLHLKNLIHPSLYTARISEQIAKNLNAATIKQMSPSFGNFWDVAANGNQSVE